MFICQMSTVICHMHSNPCVMYILYSLYDRMHPVPQKKHWNNSLSNINVYKGFGAPKELGHEVLDWKEGTHWAYGCWYPVQNAYAASDAEKPVPRYADLHMQFGEFNMHFWLYMGILGWGWSIIISIVYVYVYNHTITVFIPYCTKISCYTDAPWCQNTNFLHLPGQQFSKLWGFQWFENVPSPISSTHWTRYFVDQCLDGCSATRFKSLVENNGDCRANRLGKTLGKSGTPSFETKVYNLGFWWWCDHTLEAHTSSVLLKH